MMRAAPSYRHPDVFTDMMTAAEKAAQEYSQESLQLITPELGRFDDLENKGLMRPQSEK